MGFASNMISYGENAPAEIQQDAQNGGDSSAETQSVHQEENTELEGAEPQNAADSERTEKQENKSEAEAEEPGDEIKTDTPETRKTPAKDPAREPVAGENKAPDGLYGIWNEDSKSITFSESKPEEKEDVTAEAVTDLKAYLEKHRDAVSVDLTCGKKIPASDFQSLFSGMKSLKTVKDLGNIDSSNAKDATDMFRECSALTHIDLSGLDFSHVTDMKRMFLSDTSLTTVDFGSIDTGNVTNMAGMFHYCSSLKGVDVSRFDTSKVTSMLMMFRRCTSLRELDLSGFSTASIEPYPSYYDAGFPGPYGKSGIANMMEGCTSLVWKVCGSR